MTNFAVKYAGKMGVTHIIPFGKICIVNKFDR